MTFPYGPGACHHNHGARARWIIGTTGSGGGWPVCWRHVPHQIRTAFRWSRNPGLGGRIIASRYPHEVKP